MLLLFFLLVLLLISLYYRRKSTMSVLKRCGVPGPKPNIILGNILEMRKMSVVDYHKLLIDTYGRIVGYYIGAHPTILVADQQLIKNIQSTDFRNFTDRTKDFRFALFEKEHDGNILIATGERWKHIRRLMTPAFSPSKLKSLSPIIEESVNSFINIIEKNAETGDEFNIYPLIQRLTAEVIIKTAFGMENNIQNDDKMPFFKDIQEFFKSKPNTLLYLLVYSIPWLYHPVNFFRRLDLFNNSAKITKLGKSISQCIRLRKNDQGVHKNDILQNLIESTIDNIEDDNGKIEESSPIRNYDNIFRLTEEEVVASSVVIYGAGYDTTSTGIACVAHHLVNYPDVQEKIRQEVHQSCMNGGKLDINVMLNGLEYLECVIKETLRLYPPTAVFVSRQCTQDYHYGDITLPKGSTVIIPTIYLHNDPEYWPDPEIFDPMRFSYKRKQQIIPYTYQAFGDGPRSCVGMRLAFLEMKIVLAKLLLQYRLETGPNTEIGKLTTTSSLLPITIKHGVYLKAIKI